MDGFTVFSGFTFMKGCLKKFSYPKIHTLDDVEITEIFSKSNRQFLVCWILKQIDADYEEILEKATKEDLAEILYCSGFCTDSEKNHFMNGECEHRRQLAILNTMFTHLSSLQEAKNNDEIKPLSNEDLQNFINFDTNLFPMFGSRLVLSSAQRQDKVEGYKKEIEELEGLIQSKTLTETKGIPQVDQNLINNLSHEMECLETNLPNFQRKTLIIDMNREKKKSQINIKENFVKTLQNCDENVAETFDLIKNMNVVANFKETVMSENEGTFNSGRNNIMRQLSELCYGVKAASDKTA